MEGNEEEAMDGKREEDCFPALVPVVGIAFTCRLQIRNEINHLYLIKATASYLQKYQVVDHPPFLHLHLLVLLHSSMPQDHTQ